MLESLARFPDLGDNVRIRTAFALSILIHGAALVTFGTQPAGQRPWPGPELGAPEGFEVELATRPATAATSPTDSEAPANRGTRRASAPAKGPEWWRLTSAALAQSRAAASIGGDLSSSIAARRREHALESSAADAGRSGSDRIVGGTPAPQSPVDDERRERGGLFAITRVAYDDGEFVFYGWKDDPDPKPAQTIQVRLGANPDMRIAVVRRMIALIREHEHGDFQWQSWRLGRIVVLSARQDDNAGLEEFLLREFFETRHAAVSR